MAGSPSPLSESEMAAWRSFLRAHDRVMRALDASLRAEHELSIGDYDVCATWSS